MSGDMQTPRIVELEFLPQPPQHPRREGQLPRPHGNIGGPARRHRAGIRRSSEENLPFPAISKASPQSPIATSWGAFFHSPGGGCRGTPSPQRSVTRLFSVPCNIENTSELNIIIILQVLRAHGSPCFTELAFTQVWGSEAGGLHPNHPFVTLFNAKLSLRNATIHLWTWDLIGKTGCPFKS